MNQRMKVLLAAMLFFVNEMTLAQKSELMVADTIKSVMLKVADWQLKHSNGRPETDWTNGAFYAGVFAAYQATGSKALLDSMFAMGERENWIAGRRYDHADDYAISQTYIDLYRIKKDVSMLRSTIDSLKKMRTLPGKEEKNHGITWWWCDALFMAPPALAKLAKTFSDPSYLVYSDTLFHQCYRLLFNKEEHLFARDATYLGDANGMGKKEANGKKLFWSRGNGWVMGGLVRLLQEMPEEYPGRNFYVSLYKEMAARLLELQQQDGLWRSSLLDPDAYPGGEGSGSGFNCYALAWGLNNGLLEKKPYQRAVRRAWKSLNTLLTSEGKVGWVQPIGSDPRKNFNAESWEAYGAGAFLLAGSEVIKLSK